MSSIRQIEANRRNARLSTGPVTDEGKDRSRRNAVRHGLTAETVVTALEDAEDYEAFQMTVTADYDPQTAVERDLILRLASLLWRLRRATAIETGLFNLEASQLMQCRPKPTRRARPALVADRGPLVVGINCEGGEARHNQLTGKLDLQRPSSIDPTNPSVVTTKAFIQLSKQPTFPLDRLSRYEATLWRQVCQILFTLQCLNRPQKWGRSRGLTYR